MQETHCSNMNHGKKNPPVSYCPSCGKVVGTRTLHTCDEKRHSIRRKEGDHYCVDCGKNLKK